MVTMTTSTDTAAAKKPLPLSNWRASITTAAAAVLGLVAAVVVSIDAYHLALRWAEADCSESLTQACQQIEASAESNLLGFPNALFGLAAWPVVLTIAILNVVGVGLPGGLRRMISLMSAIGALFAIWGAFATEPRGWAVMNAIAALIVCLSHTNSQLSSRDKTRRHVH